MLAQFVKQYDSEGRAQFARQYLDESIGQPYHVSPQSIEAVVELSASALVQQGQAKPLSLEFSFVFGSPTAGIGTDPGPDPDPDPEYALTLNKPLYRPDQKTLLTEYNCEAYIINPGTKTLIGHFYPVSVVNGAIVSPEMTFSTPGQDLLVLLIKDTFGAHYSGKVADS